MSDNRRLYGRLSRRETHSPRSGLATVLIVIAILVLAYVGVEFVLRVLGKPPLLVAPAGLAQAVVDTPSYLPVALIGGGIVAAIVGLILVISAFSGGRRARHALTTERATTVIDNEVIASALARHAAKAGHTSADNTTVTVTHRSAIVRLTPASGTPVDRSAVEAAVNAQIESYGVTPRLSSKVLISDNGQVGA